jgi:PleD family two-component response regulator
MSELRKRPLLVLIASKGEWVGRSVESVLELNGYNVLRVEDGQRTLDLARGTHPAALLLDSSMTRMGGIEVCRALGEDPSFDHATPIFITSPAPVSNRERADAFAAGAWDFCTQPLDVETLLLKLRTYVRARRRLEDTLASSLIDPLTGLFSMSGLQRLAEVLGARAVRNHEPLACVAITSSPATEARLGRKPVSAALAYLAEVCRVQSRRSDVVGYVGESRFAILAPNTDEAGALQIVERIQRGLRRTLAGVDAPQPDIALDAGYYAVSDFSTAAIEPSDVVRRAEMALMYAQSRRSRGAALSFDDLPSA